ncbi:MAG: UDP-N-acetylmuramoyl-L-alanyl-D-glutamate--2,6-diaminopimelate ligase [Aquificae bacterium]|nr:UDP-N-acetylmuramoyl-L-alanyl-D-glutamate--2,6-diaminopimelate ligase [Aquificota bacterium]
MEEILKKIKGITNNSKKVEKDFLFVAIKGTSVDGHNFIEEAIKKGASFIFLHEKKLKEKLEKKYPHINFYLFENTRKAQAEISKLFYEKPDEKLKIIGVTGTNGKTTTTNLIYQYLNFLGKNTGIIGTIEYRYKDHIYASGRTTPDSIEWFYLLKDMKKKGAEYIVSEISSHAVDQHRIYGTNFTGGIFTNLSQDHLDYHKTMENYYQAKKAFFDYIAKTNPDAVAVVNTDNSYGKRLFKEIKNKLKTISFGKETVDYQISDIDISIKGTTFKIKHKNQIYTIKTKLLGEFNVYNLTASIALLHSLGFDLDFLVEKAQDLKPIKGRFETIYSENFLVVNDYAHTPDALENILKSLKKIKHNRLIVVFGAGGDRDKTKRPLMGKVAEKYADIVFLTSDNPRSENPEEIIKDIKSGMKKEPVVEIDREKAIEKAITQAKKGDIILIAGKGHETYQEIKGKKYPFDDTQIAKKYLNLL